ncbi:MAG: MlaD family protein [Candidatus Binatus sp.]|uniref:MlaD family protein n=1 Tax=Candidatus Binatus sp. TaxID=2811406 RepID=UPI0027289DAC|nr:MlaD family protein [Candidatus Binatus sp.]MDO8433074.1 MlaD family protein [Candidatus Binatus sp.]
MRKSNRSIASSASAIGAGGVFFLAMLIAGCYSPPASYSTQLDTTGGLGPGDPVTHASATIGHVTGVSTIGGGDSEVAFQVDGSHTDEIHNDSIMTLNSLGAQPSLDVMNVDAMSHAAPPGARLDGASSMNEAQLFISARGPGSYAQALSKVVGGNTPTPQMIQMQQMLGMISRQTIANAMAISPPSRQEVETAKREAAGVERQLMRNGKVEQAERLRTQIGGIMPGMTAPTNPLAIPLTSPNP